MKPSVTKLELKLLWGAAWSLLGTGLTRALLLGASVAAGRELGVVDFGKLGMVQTTTVLFGAIAGSGLGLAATAVVARARRDDPALAGGLIAKAYRLVLLFGAAGTLFIFAASPVAQLRPELRLAAPLVLFGALNLVQGSALAGLDAFRALAAASLVRGVVSFACVALGAHWGGLRGAIAGQLVAELVSAVGFHLALLSSARAQRVPLWPAAPLKGVRLMRDIALPTVLGTLALQLSFWLSNVLLASGPSGFSEVGLFNAADRWRQILLFVPTSLSANVLSALSELDGANNRTAFRRVFRRSLAITLVVVLVPALAAAAWSPVLLQLFGGEYQRGAVALAILAGSCLPVALNNSLGQVLIARGKVWWRFFVDLGLAVALLVAATAWVPGWGAAGMAMAHAVAFAAAAAALAVALPFSARPVDGASPAQPLLLHLTTVPETLHFLHGQIAFMKEQGFTVAAASSAQPALRAFSEAQGIRSWAVPLSRRISPFADLVAVARLVWLFLRARPTVLHAHTPKAGLLGMIAGAVAGVPVRIYHLHGLPMETARGAKRLLLIVCDRVACALAHRVLAVSPSLLAAAVAHGLVDPAKAVVPAGGSINGVDAQVAFSPQTHREAGHRIRQRYGLPAEALVIGFVGRVCRDKGFIELGAAWRTLRARFTQAHLLVVGPVDDTNPLPDDALAALRSDARVHFVGLDWDVAPYMAAMNVLVLPTYREGLGNVLLEAGAMGLPVVATQTTGCVDAVVDGRTGLLVPPKDAVALASAITAYLESQALRQQHGAAAREHVLARFAQPVVWSAMAHEYQRAMGHRGAGRFAPSPVQVAGPA